MPKQHSKTSELGNVLICGYHVVFFFSSRRRHTRYWRDWSSDVCSSDLGTRLHVAPGLLQAVARGAVLLFGYVACKSLELLLALIEDPQWVEMILAGRRAGRVDRKSVV